jgi:hypothetical protein
MKRLHVFHWISLAALIAGAASPAIAEHGKVGQWDITVTTKFPGMPQPDPSDRWSPEARNSPFPDARPHHYNHCMTAEEVASTTLPPMNNRFRCTISNPRVEGTTFRGDLTCTSPIRGDGGISVTYDSPEHYTGSARIDGTMFGQDVEMVSTFEGTWKSATCDEDD